MGRITHIVDGVRAFRRDAVLLPGVAFGLPPGQWPGGTGESPVLPKNYGPGANSPLPWQLRQREGRPRSFQEETKRRQKPVSSRRSSLC